MPRNRLPKSHPVAVAPATQRLGRTVLLAWLGFVVTLVTLQAILEWIDPRVWHRILDWNAVGTAWGLSAIGTPAHAEGRFVVGEGLRIEIIRECTAVHPAILFLAAVVGYPSGWRAKLLGAALGLPALMAINLLRLVGVCYVGSVRPAFFETAELLVGQSLIFVATLLLWLAWAVLLVPRHDTRRA